MDNCKPVNKYEIDLAKATRSVLKADDLRKFLISQKQNPIWQCWWTWLWKGQYPASNKGFWWMVYVTSAPFVHITSHYFLHNFLIITQNHKKIFSWQKHFSASTSTLFTQFSSMWLLSIWLPHNQASETHICVTRWSFWGFKKNLQFFAKRSLLECIWELEREA